MNSRELAYTDETTAYLVVGRMFHRRLGDDVFDELCGRIDGLAGELGQPLVVLPAGDFTTRTGGPVSDAPVSCVAGLLVRSAGTYGPRACGHDTIGTTMASARELPWQLIVDMIPVAEYDSVPEPADDVALWLTACGTLAGGMVGYGVRVALRDEDNDEFVDGEAEESAFFADLTGPAGVVSGLELVRGNSEDQEPQYYGVYGVWVARALYDGPIPITVDISADAHAKRVAKLGALADEAAYYLIGHYD